MSEMDNSEEQLDNPSRRKFLIGTGGVATFATAGSLLRWAHAAEPAQSTQLGNEFPAPNLTPRTLIGYSSEYTVRPGDTIEFMASALNGDKFNADLVRVVNGDSRSRYYKGFQVDKVAASFDGEYQGVTQPLNLGSYVHIENTGPLDVLKSFSVSCWIYPTFNPVTYEAPDLDNIDPFSPPTLNIAASLSRQTLVSRYDAEKEIGWALAINNQFQLEFVSATGKGNVNRVTLSESLKDWDWTYVSASYDADTSTLTLFMHEKPYAPGDQFMARSLQKQGTLKSPLHKGPLRIAAVRNGQGAKRATLEKPAEIFNGRIQDVRILNTTLTAVQVDELAAETIPSALTKRVVAAWDFSQAMSSSNIKDSGKHGLHGVAVNLPERAVRGRFWDGSTINWNEKPEQYDAITFHADDLYDAEWEAAFSYDIPKSLKSGVYAARLTQGEFVEYITFFVAPAKNKPTAKLAVWMSEYNYLAYSNITLGATAAKNYPGHNFNDADTEFLKDNLEYGTGGVYNQHVDGLYYIYGSRKRPEIHMKPGAFLYGFAQDTHITAFLEHQGIDYDIITDELVEKEGVELLKQYTAVMSSTHPEYVPMAIFDAVSAYSVAGGRFMYLGGNGWFWSTGNQPSFPGVLESRNFCEIPERYLTNGDRGGLMVETGRNNGPVFGNEMGGMIFNGSSGYNKLDDASNPRASWIFANTSEGKLFGEYGVDRVFGGAAGFEIDRYNPGNGTPRHALHLATSDELKPKVEDVKMGVLPLTISYHPGSEEIWAQADLVFFETPNGGAMFSTGSICWISSTLENNFNNDISTITLNVVKRFLDEKPFTQPAQQEQHDINRGQANPKYSQDDPRLED